MECATIVTCFVCDCDASSSISATKSTTPLAVSTPSSNICPGENRQSYGNDRHELIVPSAIKPSMKSENGEYIGVP